MVFVHVLLNVIHYLFLVVLFPIRLIIFILDNVIDFSAKYLSKPISIVLELFMGIVLTFYGNRFPIIILIVRTFYHNDFHKTILHESLPKVWDEVVSAFDENDGEQADGRISWSELSEKQSLPENIEIFTNIFETFASDVSQKILFQVYGNLFEIYLKSKFQWNLCYHNAWDAASTIIDTLKHNSFISPWYTYGSNILNEYINREADRNPELKHAIMGENHTFSVDSLFENLIMLYFFYGLISSPTKVTDIIAAMNLKEGLRLIFGTVISLDNTVTLADVVITALGLYGTAISFFPKIRIYLRPLYALVTYVHIQLDDLSDIDDYIFEFLDQFEHVAYTLLYFDDWIDEDSNIASHHD